MERIVDIATDGRHLSAAGVQPQRGEALAARMVLQRCQDGPGHTGTACRRQGEDAAHLAAAVVQRLVRAHAHGLAIQPRQQIHTARRCRSIAWRGHGRVG